MGFGVIHKNNLLCLNDAIDLIDPLVIVIDSQCK